MKVLTFAVPSYNSQDYLERCINTLLAGGDAVEIIIVNDGSSDNTGMIADRYAAAHPDVIKVIHQENGGHGGAVNAGLECASGKYFKVVDSDDWLDGDALARIISAISRWEAEDTNVDLIVSNYVYDHLHENRRHTIRYRNIFEDGEICGWEDTGTFLPSQYLVMHSLIFKTRLLRDCGLKLPRHTFYVDNIFACRPLPMVKDICYLDVDLYHYFLGRDDQSVNEEVMKQRIDQQIKVTRIILECVDFNTVESSQLSACLKRNMSIMMAISSLHLLLIGTNEALEKRRGLWESIKDRDSRLYLHLRYRTVSGLTYLPGRLGRVVTIGGYRTAKRMIRFR